MEVLVKITIGLALFVSSLGCMKTLSDTPELVCVEEQYHNFGEHSPGEVLTHEFMLQNKSCSILEIRELRSTCTCTTADSEKRPIATRIRPGSEISIPLRFTIPAIGEVVTGRLLVFYGIEGDLKRHALPLIVQANVRKSYKIDPPAIHLGAVEAMNASLITRRLQIIPSNPVVFELEDVVSEDEWITVRHLASSKDDRSISVDVDFDLGMLNTGPFSGGIVVSTNCLDLPRVIIPVDGAYAAPATLDKEAIIVGSDRAGQVNEIVKVTTAIPSVVELAEISGESGLLKVQIADREASVTHDVIIQISSVSHPLDAAVRLNIQFPRTEAVRRANIVIPVHRFPTSTKTEDLWDVDGF